ncbi:MAG: cytochrome c oxidase subunit II [Flavobacteriales bacterium]
MMTLLVLLVIALGIIAVVQMARVYEITSKLRGKREEEISPADNRMNGKFMWVFCVLYYAFFGWLLWNYSDKLLPVSASAHGVVLDDLMTLNWVILFIMFLFTNTLLFYFAGKYYFRKDRVAKWYPHNNKLELAWTIAPALFLAVIVITGLRAWQDITAVAPPGTPEVELYAKQFDWTCRYPGKDGLLGATDFRLINDNNPLGIVTPASIATRLTELQADKDATSKTIEEGQDHLPPDALVEMKNHFGKVSREMDRIVNLRTMMQQDIDAKKEASKYAAGADDIVIKEFHLPVNEEVKLVLRSRDIIHSAFLPHFRAQMNLVPGQGTLMKMTPTITTDSMRSITENPAFNYILLCNKICGASHYNMQMELVIEQKGAYDAWVAGINKKPFEGGEAAPTDVAPPAAGDSTGTVVKDSPDGSGVVSNPGH